MTWFAIPKDWCRGRCSVHDCYNVAEWRLEDDGSAREFCVNCRAKIERLDIVERNQDDFAEPYPEPQQKEGR